MQTTHPLFDPRTRLMSLVLLLAVSVACGGDGGGSATPHPGQPSPQNPWSVPQALENGAFDSSFDPQPAMDISGRTLVTWNGVSGSNSAIWANRYLPGNGWTGFGTIESLDGDALNQKIAMNDDGVATIAWEQGTGTSRIQSFRYIPGVGFDGLVDPVSDSGFDAKTPAVAVNTAGDATAVWRQSDGVHDHLWANRYSVSAGWGTPFQVDENTSEDVRNPGVAMDSSGDIVVVWHQSADLNQGVYSVWACHYWPSQGWSQPLKIQAGSGDARNPAVVMSDREARAVWSEIGAGETTPTIYTSRYTVISNVWETPVALSSGKANADWPSIALGTVGDCVVAWSEAVGAQSYAVMALSYDPLSGGWEAPGSFDKGEASTGVPVVSMNRNGLAVVAWNRDEGSNINVYAVRYNRGWEYTFLVSPDEGGKAYSPAVSVGAAGDIITAWMQLDPTTRLYHILASQR